MMTHKSMLLKMKKVKMKVHTKICYLTLANFLNLTEFVEFEQFSGISKKNTSKNGLSVNKIDSQKATDTEQKDKVDLQIIDLSYLSETVEEEDENVITEYLYFMLILEIHNL